MATSSTGRDQRSPAGRRPRSLARWLWVAAWAAVIFALSSIPNTATGDAVLPIDKAAHVVEFAVLAILIMWALSGQPMPVIAAVAVTLAVSLAYGALDEWHQSFVPGRDPSLTDLATDALGAVVGVAAAAMLARWRSAGGPAT
jgi:VanZ family protein